MKIRLATLEDLPQLAQLFDAYRVFYEAKTDIENATLFLTERIKNQESVIFVAEENNVLTGFTQLYPSFSSVAMKRLWILNDLFVTPKQRGKGISIALIDAAKEHCIATKNGKLLLETAKTNDIGNQLYPKMGFTLIDDENFYAWSNPNSQKN